MSKKKRKKGGLRGYYGPIEPAMLLSESAVGGVYISKGMAHRDDLDDVLTLADLDGQQITEISQRGGAYSGIKRAHESIIHLDLGGFALVSWREKTTGMEMTRLAFYTREELMEILIGQLDQARQTDEDRSELLELINKISTYDVENS